MGEQRDCGELIRGGAAWCANPRPCPDHPRPGDPSPAAPPSEAGRAKDDPDFWLAELREDGWTDAANALAARIEALEGELDEREARVTELLGSVHLADLRERAALSRVERDENEEPSR